MNIIIAVAAFFGGLLVPAAAKDKILSTAKALIDKIIGLFKKK